MYQAMRQLNESNDEEKGQIAIKHLRKAKKTFNFVHICTTRVSTERYRPVDKMIAFHIGICCKYLTI